MSDKENNPKFRVIGINISRNLSKFAQSLEKALNELETSGYSINSVTHSGKGVVVIGLLVEQRDTGFFPREMMRAAEHNHDHKNEDAVKLSDGAKKLYSVIRQVGTRVPPTKRTEVLKQALEATVHDWSPTEISGLATELEMLGKSHQKDHEGSPDPECMIVELFMEAVKVLRSFSTPNIH